MDNVLKTILTILGITALYAIILGLPIMLLWNWLIPTIWGGPHITFFQAIGLYFLCSSLFKSSTSKSKE